MKMMKATRISCLLACMGLLASACSKEAEQSSRNPDWERGRAVYVANCVACHNNDPAKDGPIGPALKGSSQELLEFRVLRTEYPPGYKPKRDTKVMPTFPFLKTEIPYLTAYLQGDGLTSKQEQNIKNRRQNESGPKGS
jgi:mono/diheme cytochrome c family protein